MRTVSVAVARKGRPREALLERIAGTGDDVDEERAIAESGLGVSLTVAGSTAREHGLVVGETLVPSETVL
jgi:hypothetical protein